MNAYIYSFPHNGCKPPTRAGYEPLQIQTSNSIEWHRSLIFDMDILILGRLSVIE